MSVISRLMAEISSIGVFTGKAYEKAYTEDEKREKTSRAAGTNTDSNVDKDVSDNTKAANTSEGSGIASNGVKSETKSNTEVKEEANAESEVNEEIETGANMSGVNPSVKTGTFMDELAKVAGFTSSNPQNVDPAQNVTHQNPVTPQTGFNPFAYGTAQQNAGIFGRHKVDNPQQANPNQKQVLKKGDTVDDVNIDLPDLNIEVTPPKPPKEWPESVKVELPKVDHVEEKPVAVFDNSAITSTANCRYLKDIEKLALESGLQIQMAEQLSPIGHPTGLINCFVYTPESTEPNLLKCFTIDTGMIIDRRPKLIPAVITFGYENYPMFYILTPKQDENGKKTKNILNEELFKSIFTGGVKMLNPKDSLYTKDFMQLNKYVALITMPTNNMSKDTRKEIQNRLMSAMKAGVFDSVSKDGAIRFVFSEYNKHDNSFILRSGNVPLHYGSPVLSAVDKGLHFTFENGAPKTKVIS